MDAEITGQSDYALDAQRSSSVFKTVLVYLTLVSRLVLGGIFLLAGLTKLGDFKGMVESIDSYQIYLGLPRDLLITLQNTMATVLPPLEIVLGALLLLGLFTRLSAAITGGLVVIFLVALIQAMARGFGDLISCGCFATGPTANPIGTAVVTALGPIGQFLTNEKADATTIVRDLLFLLMAVHLVFVPTVFGLDNLIARRRNQAYYEPDEYDQEEDTVRQTV